MRKTREGKKSKFIKAVAVTLNDFLFIQKIKGKKSKAGMLECIIAFYKENEKDKSGIK